MIYVTAKEEEAMRECYRKLYKASTPPADFDELLKNATINENGQKVIDYNAHEICEYEFSEIMSDVIKEYKIRTHRQDLFKNTILLGCSPKFKKTEE
jgi:type IV secretory pathway VirB4 component